MTTHTSVLIVGGGLNGLSTALFLASRNVRCMLVERHANTSIQYKFSGISPRSMEILRSVGIEEEIRNCKGRDQKSGIVIWGKNLADPNIRLGNKAWSNTSDISPILAATCEQDQLEPILRANAEQRGADVRFNTELVNFEQTDAGVKAVVRNRSTQTDETVNAAYIIAADGVHGTMREKLGIKRHGAGVLQHWVSVIFDTDMSREIEGQLLTAAILSDINGTLVPRDQSTRWSMAVQYFPEHGHRPEDFNDERCLELIRKGAGRFDINAKVIDVRHWEAAAYVADRYREGRAFLVGDAAHVMPPTGGFGGNTGVHDAHNIAWKLAEVLRGTAAPSLLDTYDSERRPVAEHTLAQALARLQTWFHDPAKKLPPPVAMIPDEHVIFGYLYHSGATISEEGITKNDPFEDPHTPSGRTGSRAPHMIVEYQGKRVSTIDLCNGEWVLLVGREGENWVKAVERLNLKISMDLKCYQFGSNRELRDVEGRWSSVFGVTEGGAVLIRPDGFIAWRATDVPAQPEMILHNVVKRLTFRDKSNETSSG